MNVKSATRALKILRGLGEKPQSHVELSVALDIPRSSLTGLLTTMMDDGFVTYDANTRLYGLGPEVLLLAQRYLAGINVVTTGQAMVAEIVRETGESTALVVRAGDDILVVAKQNSETPIRRSMQLGERAPMSLTAAGRVFLAYMSKAERERIIGSSLAETGLTAERIERLEAHLHEVRAGAVAYSREDLLSGVIAMALPVFDANGAVEACLSVSAPTSRFDEILEERIAGSLRRHASALSAVLRAKP
ncbi:IclR family transcriptional regulator [Aerobium aerolatum]|uniref:Transcriptional regulator, IclR family n=1 Tax=Aquamicrobium aerolatum DSM 21857 TaxID=1121003 RepID=A0A1I3SM72_9HYPH|nr:IclR family transcriptional regulator [Aquamicrobium aerolatum]SFJ58711.1 transcriptional regulator, IclR family [Aquamicrobium aerolatum DSM 21857]